jgi:dCMP deaminase
MEWDPWFLEICNVIAKKSQCLSRKIGAVLTHGHDIVSTGYNGPPRGLMTCDERWFSDEEMVKAAGFDNMSHEEFLDKWERDLKGVCPRYVPEMGFKSGQGLEWCNAGHAERNALINAARHGINTIGTTLYMDCGIPCTPCLTEIINAGVSEIVVTKIEYYDKSAEFTLENSLLCYRVYRHLKEG